MSHKRVWATSLIVACMLASGARLHANDVGLSAELIADAIGFEGNLVFNTEYPDGAPFKILDDRRFKEIFPDYQFSDHRRGIRETVEYYRSVL